MKSYFLIILLACSFAVKAQSNAGNYKYLIVPEKFSFLKQANQYNLNSLTKVLFEEKGFTVYFDNADLPTEIATDRCKALTVDLQENNSMFVTSLTVLLKDCKGTIILKSKEGKSREKEYRPAYNFALREAFASLNELHYVAGSTPEVANPSPVVQSPETKTTLTQTPVNLPTATKTEQSETKLYAQPITKVYQLIDSTPKIVMTLQKTSVDDYLIANNGNTNGIVLKKSGSWFFEYYKDNVLVSEKLSIKF